MLMGAGLVTRTVDAIIEADNQGVPVSTVPQDNTIELRPAPKIFKDTCAINFSQSAEQVYNHIRGLSPYPAAWISQMPLSHPLAELLQGAKVYKAAVTQHAEQKGHIIVPCADGYIDLLELQLPGKKRMEAAALLNGLKNK
jgi:methionyl-tRNA formyltransferase